VENVAEILNSFYTILNNCNNNNSLNSNNNNENNINVNDNNVNNNDNNKLELIDSTLKALLNFLSYIKSILFNENNP